MSGYVVLWASSLHHSAQSSGYSAIPSQTKVTSWLWMAPLHWSVVQAGGKCIGEIFSDCRMRARRRRWGTLTQSRWSECAAKGFSYHKQRWVPHQLTNSPVIVFIKRGWRVKPGFHYDIKSTSTDKNGIHILPFGVQVTFVIHFSYYKAHLLLFCWIKRYSAR